MEKLTTQASVDFARDAIKMSALGNAGAAIGVFGHNAFFKSDFIFGAFCFDLGFLFSMISCGLSYLAQGRYSMAAQFLKNGEKEKHSHLNSRGNRYRNMGLYLWWTSIVFFAFGSIMVLVKCL
jgi:hypothetical protein